MFSASYERKLYYHGDKASDYESSRIGEMSSPLSRHRWTEELRAVGAIGASLPARSVVLDAPCGTGRFFPLITAHGHRVIGADISADMLAAIPPERRADVGTNTVRCDAERLPLADRSVDVVLSMRFWSFLTDDARRDVLAEWRRVARRCVYAQVRFRVDSSRDLPPDAITGAMSAFDRPETEKIEPDQRMRWPLYQDFAEMIAAAGFTVSRRIALDWGPTSDPVFICLLVRRGRESPQSE